ncbi:unnamed protein product [Darwinula stevensoni]|uniref:2Fe-2S ferredoxin-type domain-containing protein n=1 Tax=Darwinula stevensoni TaxID=69355 RepID=A0A7R8XCC1_9CRUS|nr:unnamed protein product [Darwinula stevensoni]CAG0887378.1 unnamed protein product [Darwinula stevensoni]
MAAAIILLRHVLPRTKCIATAYFQPQYLRSYSPVRRNFMQTSPAPKKARVTVTFIRHDGKRLQIQGKEGDSLLDVVVNNDLDLEGFGACEGTLACSTCHLIFKKEDYDRLPDRPSDEELDMLDLAYGLSDTSRLGCQVVLTKDMEGLEVQVPSGTSDARGS